MGTDTFKPLDKFSDQTQIDRYRPVVFVSRGTPVSRVSKWAIKLSRRFGLLLPANPHPQFRRRVQMLIAKEVLLRTRRPAYLSGNCAAIYYGWSVLNDPPVIDLQMRDGKNNRNTTVGKSRGWKFLVRRHSLSLPDSAYTSRGGIPIIDPKYLIVEFLASNTLEESVVTAESGIRTLVKPDPRHRRYSETRWEILKTELQTIIKQRLNRRGRARALQRLELLSIWSASVGESLLRLACIRAGIADGIQQYQVPYRQSSFYLDLAWPSHTPPVAFEFDGDVKYESAEGKQALIAEKRREDYLRQFFPCFYRFCWKDLRQLGFLQYLKSIFAPKISANRPLP